VIHYQVPANLENYYQKYEYMSKIKKDISKKLKRYTPFTQYEEAFIEKWIVDFNYDLDIINIALKKTTSKSQPSFDYIDKLISNWYDRGLKSVSEIEKFLSDFKQKTKEIKIYNHNNAKVWLNQKQY
jgi:DnaD/phage-associated family protein